MCVHIRLQRPGQRAGVWCRTNVTEARAARRSRCHAQVQSSHMVRRSVIVFFWGGLAASSLGFFTRVPSVATIFRQNVKMPFGTWHCIVVLPSIGARWPSFLHSFMCTHTYAEDSLRMCVYQTTCHRRVMYKQRCMHGARAEMHKTQEKATFTSIAN